MNLKEAAVRGVAWNTMGSVGAGLCNLLVTILLARILTPSDFGIIALLVVFTIVSESLIDSGFGQALIRDEHPTWEDLNTVFFINFLIALILYCSLFAAAPLIARVYDDESVVELARFVFLVLIFKSISIVQVSVFSKNINFKATAVSSLLAVMISGVVSILLAYNGLGVWSLAVHLVLNSFIQTVLLWGQGKWRPTGFITVKSLKKYSGFSFPLLVQGFLDRVVGNFESLLIGRIYSASDLGFFSQSRNLNSYLMLALSNVAQRVTYPVLVRINSDKLKLKDGYRQVIGVTMLFMIPLSLGIVAAAENVVLVLFGEKWLTTGEYLRFFIVMGLFTALHSSYTNIFLTLGRTNAFLWLSLFKQILKVAAVLYFVGQSVKSLVFGVTLVGVVTSLLYVYVGGKFIGYSLRELVKDLSQIIVAGFIGAVLVVAIGVYASSTSVLLVLLVQVLVMLGVYVLLLSLMGNVYFLTVFGMIRRKG